MATKAVPRTCTCRPCWEEVAENRVTHLFTRKSVERGWAASITALLEVPISQQDNLPLHVCSKCTSQVSALEKATADLAAFKRSARSVMQEAHQSPSREQRRQLVVSVYPQTPRPHSKMARRLDFTSTFLKWYIQCGV